jgi:hypothetical protein
MIEVEHRGIFTFFPVSLRTLVREDTDERFVAQLFGEGNCWQKDYRW